MKNFVVLLMVSVSLILSAATPKHDIFDVRGSITELPDNDGLLSQISADWGPIVKPEDYPSLHDLLANVFSDLSLAQGRLTEGSAATVNYVHIINSTQLNAFVWTDNKVGVRLFSNHLFLTTEMVRFMLAGVSLQEGLTRIAGVIAHELGHPMDSTSAYEGEGGMAIDNHYGTEASQAVEIRADIDATRILREANYPVEALYKSLAHLFGKETDGGSLVASMASSHPHHEFRLTSARLFLTLDRLEKGLIKNSKKFQVEAAKLEEFNQELEKVMPKSGRYPYKVPQSMEEIVTRLAALRSDSTVSKQFEVLELNRLILSFDQMLWNKQQQGQELTRSERDSFATFISEVYNATSIYSWDGNSTSIYTQTEVRSQINKVSGVSGLETSPSHFYYLERLDAYKYPEVASFLSRQAILAITSERFRSEHWDSEFPQLLYAAAGVSAPDIFFKQFGPQLKELAKRLWVNTGRRKGHAEEIFKKLGTLGMQFQTKLAQLTAPLREGMQQVPFNWRVYFDGVSNQWNPIPVVTELREKNQSPILKKYRQALVYHRSGKHPEVKEQLDAIQKICNDVWNARGFYGTTEIIFQHNMIDWTLITEVLGLHHDVAMNQIESEVQKYMKGERHYEGIPPYRLLVLAGPAGHLLEGKGLESWLVWNSRNLKKSILGETKPFSSRGAEESKLFDQTEKRMAERLFDAYSAKEKKVFVSEYRNIFEPIYKLKHQTPTDFVLAIASAHLKFFEYRSSHLAEVLAWDDVYFLQTQLEKIDGSKATLQEKQTWFEYLFLKNIRLPKAKQQKLWDSFFYQVHDATAPTIAYMSKTRINGKVLDIFKKLYNQEPLDFFFRLKAYAKEQNIEDTPFYRALDASEKYLQTDIKSRPIRTYEDIAKLIDLLKPIEHRKSIYEKGLAEGEYTEPEYLADSQSVQMNSARIQRLKKTILERAKEVEMTNDQKIKMFLDLTESGPTKDTDKLFLSLVDPGKMNEDMQIRVLNYLEEGRFTSDKLKLDLAKLFIGGRVDRLKADLIEKGQPVDRYTLNKLIKDLNRYTPNGSMAKDDFLESIGWALRLRGSELDGFIDDQKSQNWRKANPLLIRVGSLLASQISRMSFEGRLKTIEYLLDPVNNETTLFNDIFEELKKITYNDLLKKSQGVLTPQKEHELKVQADRVAEVLKLKAEEAIRDSAPTERIPLFEVVLTAGKEAPIHHSDWPVNISRRYLDYTPESVEETLFTTFLEVLPRHEHAVALSYMLSLAKDESHGSIAQLFEVFGTVGIKFGQLVSIWELFGEQIAKDAAHLKNNAKALSRYDVMNLADTRHHEVKVLIEEFEKVLGSASIKTTARVRFKDGSKGVLALQGKNVHEIVSMNIELGKIYLERLKQKGVIKNSKFMMNLVEALEEQIVAELDMKGEALKTKKAGEVLAEINKEMKADLKGWTIRVPQVLENKPLTSEMAFYELAKSVSFDKLSPELKAEVGPIIAKANLRSLFKYGWFDPDRHTGNFLIDSESKTVFFLDFGQYENFSKSINPFKVDPRLVIGQFIKSLADLDTNGVIHYAQLMARTGSNGVIDEAQLRKSLNLLFNQARSQGTIDIKALMVDVINEIAESGLKFDTRYIFGGLKGLIILYGENYVAPQEFEGILRSELKTLFTSKFPAVIMESFRTSKDEAPVNAVIRCEHLF